MNASLKFARNRPRNAAEALVPRGLTALQVLEYLDYDAATDVICLAGSLADGFGNSSSDIDLYVFSPKVGIQIGPRSADGFWIDVKRFTQLEVEHWRDNCAAAANYPKIWGENILRYGQLDVLHRMSIALPFTTNARNPFEIGPITHRALAITHIFSARNFWVDLVGAILSNDYYQASTFISLMSERIIDAIAAMNGETNPNRKWRQSKLNRLPNPPQRLMSHLFLECSPSDDRKYLIECTRFLESEVLLLMSKLSGVTIPRPLPVLDFGSTYEIHGSTVISIDCFGNIQPL